MSITEGSTRVSNINANQVNSEEAIRNRSIPTEEEKPTPETEEE